jgi:hypothetical protein
VLDWLDTSAHYWGLALGALAVTSLLAVSPAFWNGRKRLLQYGFIVMLLLTLIAGRWPIFFTSASLEYDESFDVATAMTAAVQPVPWKSFDPFTVGPLEVYVLDLPKLFGIDVGYNSTHFMAVLVLWGLLSCLYLFLRRFVDEASARIAVLPALVFLILAYNGEFEHYASELFALFLLSLALVTATMSWTDRRAMIVSAALTGICLGSIPFAKTQAVPVGMLVGAAYIGLIFWRKGSPRRTALAVFVGGLLVVPVLLLGLVAVKGAFNDFVTSYIRNQTNYVAGDNTPLSFILGDAHFGEYVLVSLAITLLAAFLVAALGKPSPAPLAVRLLPTGSMALLATSLLVMFVPHKPWTHYVLFLLPPLTLLVGSTVGLLYLRLDSPKWKRTVIVCATVLILVPLVRESRTAKTPYVTHLATLRALQPSLPVSIIRSLVRPGDRMALWSTDSDMYPATGTLMGTRESNAYFQLAPNPLQDYFRARFVRDLRANNPLLFVDAVAPGFVAFTDRKSSGFETDPALAAAVHSRYQLYCDVQGIRIYERREPAPTITGEGCPERPKTAGLSAREIQRLHSVSAPAALGFIDALAADGIAGASSNNTFRSGSAIVANGWAVDPRTNKPGSALIFIIDGRLRSLATQAYGLERPDVAVSLKSVAAEFSGFVNAPISHAKLSVGKHTIQFGLVTPDKKSFYLSNTAIPFNIR